MTVNEMLRSKDFCCDINMTKREYNNPDESFDEWGCVIAWYEEDKGVEYNYCNDTDDIDDWESYPCAFYMMAPNPDDEDIIDTNYDCFMHYAINWDDKNWQAKLKKAAAKAIIELFEL